MRHFATLFLVLLLVLATEKEGGVAEARICETPSQKFKGLCFSKRNCQSVCESERFPGGNCRGLRRRCLCTRPCAD